MIIEIRRYTIAPGRIADQLARFEHHLAPLFERHGIDVVGRWTTFSGIASPSFIYMMSYAHLADRDAQWASFYADVDWARIRAETNGPDDIVERFELQLLKPHEAWISARHRKTGPFDGIQELVSFEALNGKASIVGDYLLSKYIPELESAGAQVMLVADEVTGIMLPAISVLVAWKTMQECIAGQSELASNTRLLEHRRAQIAHHGCPVLKVNRSALLIPTPFDLPRMI